MKGQDSKVSDKRSTGIDGLDRLLYGGLPNSRLTLLRGNAGTGKSVLTRQVVAAAAARGEPSLIVGFEESVAELRQDLHSFEWALDEAIEAKIHVMEAAVGDDFFRAGDFDLSGLLASVEAMVAKTGARWVVFDGIDALLRALGSRASSLREMLRLRRWVSGMELVVMVTAKADEPISDYAQDFGFMPFVADCVIELRHVPLESVFVRNLRVVKYRGNDIAVHEVPFVIDSRGIEVAFSGSLRLEHDVFTDRVSSGISSLDEVLGNGYLRGSSILVSGSPGTAKTTLGGAFVAAACERGERAVFVSFDESGVQIVRNMRSVGIDLEPHVESGALCLKGYRASGTSAEGHMIEIVRLINATQPQVLVIDPVSALSKSGGSKLAADVTERLLDRAKSQGITVLMTSLLAAEAHPDLEETRSHVSTIADTWIALSYNVRGGERNRGLTVIKSRGSRHTKEVRELILRPEGPLLTEPYTAGGEILMGTARIEREAMEKREAQRRQEEYSEKREAFIQDIQDIESNIENLSRDLADKRRRLAALKDEEHYLVESLREEQSRKESRRHSES